MSKRYAALLSALFCLFIGAFFILQFLTPDREFSPQENRYLAKLPEPKPESLLSGKFMASFETYVTDQFPGRDGWIAAKALSERLLGKGENNGVYFGRDGQTLFPRLDRPDPQQVADNISYVNKLAENVEVPVYFSLIPSKNRLWSTRLPQGAPNADEGAILAQAEAGTSARWVDLDSALRAHVREEIYYRLDHHWTSLGAYYGYAGLMEAMGLVSVPLADYEKTTVSNDFNGTTYSSSGVRWMEPDAIDIYVPEDGVAVESWRGPEPEAGRLYHWEKLEEKDKYAFFLGGNQSLAVVRTEHAEAPRLLIVRDSYTDSLAPFLTAHFSEIHLFDPRYNKTPVSRYVEENGIDQVLVLYSVANFVSDGNLFVLSK